MEVHAHSHTPRKKWTHYFWEFLMLFLAVFCGFLAENQREHLVEHQREKQYMRSMLDDLKQDTAEIASALYQIDSTILPVQNRSLNILYLDKFPDSIVRSIHEVVPVAIKTFTFSFQQRTSIQLKNSGNLRLVRKKEITDSLADYWYQCNHLETVLLAGYQETRSKAKEIMFSLFNFDNYTDKNSWSPLVENRQLQFLSTDLSEFKKLGNYISNLKGQLSGPFKYALKDAYQRAVDLIELIQRKYHLK